ncbi:MAG: NAD(P)-dependent oxidoreductase [Sphingobacteriaceae bacterium]|jgi:NADP-dependent 3-hydroxy acid dehydrogenase YdfG|nr:NAD(P)-dependent oxidoreductase [Sphingobacteriaceae bacterium]
MSKIALITGATSGIGEASAILLAQQKYNLVLIARRTERLEQLSQRLKTEYGIETQTITLDVRNNEDVQQKLEALWENWKAVDVLINNAGLSQGLDPIDKGNTDDWDVMIDTNVKGFLYVTKVVSAWMVRRQQGHIVNLGSIAGKETYLNGNVYCATKYAVDSLSQAMRIDLLPHRIKVTAINPGAVETEFSEVRFKGDEERAKKVYEGYEPLTAQDIADAIWYAVSRPLNVNINDMVITPIAQANTSHLLRKS